MTKRIGTLLLALAAAGCHPHRIPGTAVKDTPDNRAIEAVLGEYVRAFDARNAAAVLSLVAPDYLDNAGTPDPADDLDRAQLEKALVRDFTRVRDPKLVLTLRRIETHGNAAEAEVFYDDYYRVETPGGPVPRRDSDLHLIRFRKLDGQWKIVSGL